MGFFSKLFGSRRENKKDIPENLPIQQAELTGITRLKLTEILKPEYRGTLNTGIQHRREAANDLSHTGDMQDAALVDRIDVQYRFMLEYVVFDEKLLSDTVSGANLNEDLNELFCVSLTEFNSIAVSVIEGDTEEYANAVLKQFNEACKDWGIEGKSLSVKSIVPADEDREFYEAYKKVWG